MRIQFCLCWLWALFWHCQAKWKTVDHILYRYLLSSSLGRPSIKKMVATKVTLLNVIISLKNVCLPSRWLELLVVLSPNFSSSRYKEKHERKKNSQNLLNTFVLNLKWLCPDSYYRYIDGNMELCSRKTGFSSVPNFYHITICNNCPWT